MPLIVDQQLIAERAWDLLRRPAVSLAIHDVSPFACWHRAGTRPSAWPGARFNSKDAA